MQIIQIVIFVSHSVWNSLERVLPAMETGKILSCYLTFLTSVTFWKYLRLFLSETWTLSRWTKDEIKCVKDVQENVV